MGVRQLPSFYVYTISFNIPVILIFWSGEGDSNSRSLVSKTSTIPDLATARFTSLRGWNRTSVFMLPKHAGQPLPYAQIEYTNLPSWTKTIHCLVHRVSFNSWNFICKHHFMKTIVNFFPRTTLSNAINIMNNRRSSIMSNKR